MPTHRPGWIFPRIGYSQKVKAVKKEHLSNPIPDQNPIKADNPKLSRSENFHQTNQEHSRLLKFSIIRCWSFHYSRDDPKHLLVLQHQSRPTNQRKISLVQRHRRSSQKP
jgi:hypothetical protein